MLTFIVPAGRFSVHDIEYKGAGGETQTRTVLMPVTFRYSYNLNTENLSVELKKLAENADAAKEAGIDQAALQEFVATDPAKWSRSDLSDLGLNDDALYKLYGTSIYDTSKKLHKTAKIWGTDDFYGFGFLNYIFEGLVTGSKYGSAVGIVALILVVGGAFGIIMKTGAVEAGIYAFIRKTKGLERLALPLLFFLFSLGGATFGMSEEVIPFAMIMVPFVIALGYDSIVAVTVTFVASQVGNAVSWMSPFSVAIAQGIADIPVLSGAKFRLILWCIVTALSAGYMMLYAEKIRKDPKLSVVYNSDSYFRDKIEKTTEEEMRFTLGHKLILLEMLAVLIWIIWGVTQKEYYIPEIASQFFVMGLAAGVTAVIFKLNNMGINEMASAFQGGVADLAGTAVVVGMAKGILLVLGGADATVASALNTILYSIGNLLKGVPFRYSLVHVHLPEPFQPRRHIKLGDRQLTMPIMAPLSDVVGVSRQIAVLAYQMGAGFVDAFTPVSASLIGVLGVARIDWSTWAKFQIKMQGFFFLMGTVAIIIAIAINFQ